MKVNAAWMPDRELCIGSIPYWTTASAAAYRNAMTARRNKRQSASLVEEAAAELGRMSLSQECGSLLGSEDMLINKLQVSRATLRQAARLVEREGLVQVRRGTSGGYLATRPDPRNVEAAVSGYLATLPMDFDEVTTIASALWVEVVRKAAMLDNSDAKAVVSQLRKRLKRLKAEAEFDEIGKMEEEFRAALFALTNSRYIELIFQINIAFVHRWSAVPERTVAAEAHSAFVVAWRNMKLMELEAIVQADPDLGAMAARQSRKLWHGRIAARLQPEKPAG